MVYITRRETFAASHRLYNPDFSYEKNLEVYGKCSNPNGHGHNYVLEIVVCGEVNKETGYLIDLKTLKKIILDHVVDKLDHQNLNMDVDFLKGIIPSSENICIAIWKQLEDKLPAGKLYSVKLYETQNNYVEYRGDRF